jgi:hypothetical protein
MDPIPMVKTGLRGFSLGREAAGWWGHRDRAAAQAQVRPEARSQK